MNKKYYRVLSIAGSDSSGGAGIQADLKTISACGCYGMTAITAITIQNTQCVYGIHPIPVNDIKSQIEVVIEDIGVDAIKIGMLHSAEVIHTIVDTLKKYSISNIISDPVMVATSGDKLLQDEAIDVLVKELFPITLLITPNIPEAEILLNAKITNQNELINASKELNKFGSKAVLIKAGHLQDKILTDILYDSKMNKITEYSSPRIDTKNTHGTGCSLSSAIASNIAKGYSLDEAVSNAKEFISCAIAAGANYSIGKGHGPIHHFYKYWE